MKSKFFITVSAVMMLTMAGFRVNATTYSYIHVDSTFTYDFTFAYCPNNDSIMLIGPTGGGTSNWRVDGQNYYNRDTLVLPIGAIYSIGDSLSISGELINFLIAPLTVTGTGGALSCGDSTMLQATTNHEGPGTLAYAWSPVTGLSNPVVANPYAYPVTPATTIYTVSLTLDGCTITDTAAVSFIPGIAPGICMVGVDSATNKNMVIWDRTDATLIDTITIYRETNTTGVYVKIHAQPFASLNVFIDTSSYPNVQSGKYRISGVDHCGFDLAFSDYHKTMHLTINQGQGTAWNLIWEAYEGFVVLSYQIYRGTAADNLQLIGTTSGSSTQYSDFTAPSGNIYYQIKVINPSVCNPTKSYNFSCSNIATNNPNGIFVNGNEPDLFTFYPNPAKDKIKVSMLKKATIEILTIEGQIVKTFDVVYKELTIDLGNLSQGVYLIKATTDKEISIKRFVKQ